MRLAVWLLCGWVLWMQQFHRSGLVVWSPQDSYESIAECNAATERRLVGLDDGVTYRREGATLRRVDGRATFVHKCLPDNIDPRPRGKD